MNSTIDPEVRAIIHHRLAQAEAEHDVRILFAIESGSRAWGFASPNSDYDVRFVYAHRPDWYQSVDLEERRDVIEYPIVDEIDLNGWDVRKALRLFWRSNPTFVEWLQSPVTYLEQGRFRAGARELLAHVYAPVKGVHHYRSMASTNYRRFLTDEQVPLKKYFYVLRPLLASRWLIGTLEAAPIEFERLLPQLGEREDLLAEIHRLLERKRAAQERELIEPIASLNEFIEAELDAPVPDLPLPGTSPQGRIDLLNALFHEVLQEQAGGEPSASAV